MFYSQPLSTRFGTDLVAHIQSGTWDRLDFAVAWVRASGLIHIEPDLKAFLASGKELHVIVGVDLDNTTREGLASLLELKKHGAMSVFVHHNEAGTIFHPKLYLFQNSKQAKLIVGSNNITEAGLYRNTEAGLELDADINDPVITSAINALEAWRDTKFNLARELDAAFLDELVSNGYIYDEATVNSRSASRRATSGVNNGSGKKLFGSVSVTPPSKPSFAQPIPPAVKPAKQPSGKATSTATTPQVGTTPAPIQATPTTTGQVLLMRVRKARGTQIQIPLAVMREPFFTGVTQVFSVADGVLRGIHETHPGRAKGKNPNTLKLEMPETRSMGDPVARFERTATGIQYEVYDVLSAQGSAIMQALRSGQKSSPPTTKLTLPSNPGSATWWRFI